MKSTGELASEVLNKRYPRGGFQYDHALPESWVDEMRAKGWSPVGDVVWLYDADSLFGRPEPFTIAGALMLEVLTNG